MKITFSVCAITATLTAAAVAPSVSAQTAVYAPAGWKTEKASSGATVFTPSDLKPGEVYKIAVFDSAPLNGKALKEWLQAFAGPVGPGAGKLTAPLKITENEGTVSGTGVYAGPNGTALSAIFLGVSLDGANVHAIRVLLTENTDLVKRYGPGLKTIIGSVTSRAKREAGSKMVRVPAGLAKTLKRGGAIVPGVYAGNQYYGEKLRRRLRVYLYPSGEYRVCDSNDKDLEFNTGQYEYKPSVGQLDIGGTRFDLKNDSYNPNDDFCYYGRDAQGKPMIYAENDHGFKSVITTLRYVGTGKRPAPNAEKVAKAAADAEAKRYKYVTAPGRGVSAGQIATIVHHYDVQLYSAGVSGMGTNTTDEAYLLLKDGTIHDGIPVAPDQLDAALSRRREPEKWGRWRRQGAKYMVSWNGGPYKTLPGSTARAPQAGQRLQGRWGTGSSSASLAGSSYSLWGVTFTKDGRFVKDGRGGSGNSLFMQTGGQAAINSTYDDNGSVTSATGGNFTVMAKNKKNPNGSREGTYSISGYTMTLRYDNGQVARIPFFFTGPGQKTIWFEGNQLAFDDKKN